MWLGNRLLQATVQLMTLMASVGGLILLEHPRNPGVQPFPSIWIMDIIRDLLLGSGGRLIHLDQCRFGSLAKNATTLLVNFHWCSPLMKKCNHQTHALSLKGLHADKNFKTKQAENYPSELCQAMAECLMEGFLVMWKSGSHGTCKLGEQTSSTPREQVAERVRVPPLSSYWSQPD